MNRSVALQFWLIAALVPSALLILTIDAGGSDFHLILGRREGKPSAGARRLSTQIAIIKVMPQRRLFIRRTPCSYFIPFARCRSSPATGFGIALTAGLFYWAARPYCPKGFPPILVVLTPAALTCYTFGQTGLLFGALWLLAFRGKWAAVALAHLQAAPWSAKHIVAQGSAIIPVLRPSNCRACHRKRGHIWALSCGSNLSIIRLVRPTKWESISAGFLPACRPRSVTE